MRQLKIQKSITNRSSEALDKYFIEINRAPLITIDEEIELAQLKRKGGVVAERAKEKLVVSNLRFVVSVAKQYQHQGLSLVDLIDEGNIGLIRAADKFDETRGFKFISYAVWWIRQSILQAIAEQSRIVRLPLNQVGSLSKINREITTFRDFYGELVPACLIIYDRTAYFEPEGDLRLTIDSRMALGSTRENTVGTLTEIAETCGCTVDVERFSETHYVPGDSPFVKTLIGCYEDVYGRSGSKPLAIGGGTYVHEVENGVAFGCVEDEDETNLHGDDEHIAVEDLLKGSATFALAIYAICGGE